MKSDIYNSFLHLPLHAYKYSTRQGMTRGGAVVGFSARARGGEKQRLPGGKKDLEVERNMTWVFSVPLCIRGSSEFECVRRRARGCKNGVVKGGREVSDWHDLSGGRWSKTGENLCMVRAREWYERIDELCTAE